MNVRLGRMGAVAITHKQCISALSGWRWLQAMQVRKLLCNERQWESEGDWDQCAALFITAALHQPPNLQPNRGADCLPHASLPLFLCFPPEDLPMMLFLFFRGGGGLNYWFSKNLQKIICVWYLHSKHLPAYCFAFLFFPLCLTSWLFSLTLRAVASASLCRSPFSRGTFRYPVYLT